VPACVSGVCACVRAALCDRLLKFGLVAAVLLKCGENGVVIVWPAAPLARLLARLVANVVSQVAVVYTTAVFLITNDRPDCRPGVML
jgi:hypothetical protein